MRISLKLAIELALCTSPIAFAHAAAPDDSTLPEDLIEVVVTGRSGVDERTKEETSYSITTINEERLRMQAPTSVTESLKAVPGFWVEASGGEGSGNVRARGIPVDGFGSITLLEDGMPVQHDPALGWLNGDQAFRLDESIERIEVVRGGPASIFYSNAPAGAVNYIRRRVGEAPEGSFKYTWGDFGLNRFDAWYGAPLGEWDLSVGGFYRFDDGVRDPGFHANDGGQLRVSLDRDLENGRISFDVKRVDDNVALYLGIPMRTYANGEIRGVPGFDDNHGTLAGPETALIRMRTASGDYEFDNTLGTEVKRTQATLALDLNLTDELEFSNRLRYNDTKTQRNGVYPLAMYGATAFLAQSNAALGNYPGATSLQLRYASSPNVVFDTANQNGNGLVSLVGLRGLTIPVTELMNDARVMRKFELGSQSHDVTLGYYVGRAEEDFSRYSSNAIVDIQNNARLLDMVAVNAAGTVVGTLTDHGIWRYGYEWENANGQSTTTAVYLSDEWQVTEQLRIDAGVRWEEVHVTGNTEIRQQVNLGTPATSQIWTGTGQFAHFDQKLDKAGWTLGANWQFTPRSGVFARYTPTFRLPNLSSYITSPTAQPVVQTMDLGEVGFKYSNGWMSAYSTLFWTKYDNVGFSNYVFNAQTGASTVQQGYADTETYGMELETGFYPVEWFDVTLTATLQDPKYKGLRYTELVAGSPVLRDFVDNRLIRVPETSVRVVPGINLLEERLRLQVAYEYQGNRFVDTANSVRLPSYDVWNASASYTVSESLSAFAYLDNLSNSVGLTEGNPRAGELQSADAGANTFFARPILGRTYRVALMYRF